MRSRSFGHDPLGFRARRQAPGLVPTARANAGDDAASLGLDRTAESSRGLTIHQLNPVLDRHVRPETYAAAVARSGSA